MQKIRNNSTLTIIAFVIAIAIIIPFQTGCSHENNEPTINVPSTKRVQIAAVGDFLMHMPVVNSSYNSQNNDYEFTGIFEEIIPYFLDADLTIANLETTLAGDSKGFTGYPCFNSPSVLARDMKEIGIDIVTTANNHCMDYGEEGLLNTIDTLKYANLKHLGTYKSYEEQNTPLIVDVEDIIIGLINYTQTTNGIPIPQNKDYLVNIIDEEQIMMEIERLENEEVDIIIACIHFGEEYQRKPNAYQQDLVDKLFLMGVDIILGNHAHVIQPMEKRELQANQDSFVIYSLGNFISNQRWRYSDSGLILNLILEKNCDTGQTIIREVNYIPTWVHTYTKENRLHYRVLPVYKGIYNYELELDPLISQSDYQRLCEVWRETTNHVDPQEMNILPVTSIHTN